ncbi:intraflagellar transport protein 80 homolog [Ischnura elegans]|uniref:intraflagellar transport protein 80 homolog n=1 Tax=Ischnura elegans TaxID=197161 RepID=UPI001ED8718D|nr:intraflagellar transport protein 80 homolog [Ischnura elegans]
MKLKTYLLRESDQNAAVTCVGWSSTDEVYSCGDDHVLLKWNLTSKSSEKITVLPNGVFPCDLHCLPSKQASNKISYDPILITTSDGKFQLIGKNGRIEKSVEAHKGAALVGRWNNDGSSFLTGGEEGWVKGWSRSGLLRWSLEPVSADNDTPAVHCAAWAPDGNSVVHGSGSTLFFRSLVPGSKPLKIKAHDSLILALDWCPTNNLLVSGGEDCRYKVWDSFGHLIYSSSEQNFPITSLSWCPGGDILALGSFNTLRLCDKSGWSHCQEKPGTGSILALSWSADGTRVVGACSNGQVILAHTIDWRLEWKHTEVLISGKRSMTVRNILAEGKDKDVKLEVGESGERVVRAVLNHDHLVVLTQRHCYLWDTSRPEVPPVVVPIKESSSATLLLLAHRHFLLWERSGPTVYSYNGRPLCSPQWMTLRPDLPVHPQTVSLGAGLFAVRDQIDFKAVHLFDVGCGLSGSGVGKEMVPVLSHALPVLNLAINQAPQAVRVAMQEDPMISFVDGHGDLHLFVLRYAGSRNNSRHTIKLGTMVTSIVWCSDWDMLAATCGSCVSVWTCPPIAYVDRRLLRRTVLERESSEFGRGSLLLKSFEGSQVWLRRMDGALTGFCIPPHAALLTSNLHSHSWQQSLRLCRSVGNAVVASSLHELMWACLAGAALRAGQLGPAQEAYASLEEADRVNFIQYIQGISNPAVRTAAMTLLAGHSTDEVEGMLIRSGMGFQAIMLNIHFFHWERALQLAKKQRNHVDVVLYFRKKHLERLNQKETQESFIKAMKSYADESGSSEISYSQVKENIQSELEKEKSSGEIFSSTTDVR